MTDLSVVILGSSGTIPTRFRNLPAVTLKRNSRTFLFDAGEGTQIQFIKASLSMHKISDIFISHLHGDHIGGIPGILQSLSLLKRENPMRIFGPTGIGKFISAIYDTMNFELTFPVKVIEVKSGILINERDFHIECVEADHKINAFAYGFFEKPRPGRFYPKKAERLGIPKRFWKSFQRKQEVTFNNTIIKSKDIMGPERPGRKVVYAVDTRPCVNVLNLSGGVDLLIHDGMFADALKDKAKEGGHSTVSEAATLAKQARVKKLILTHISSRYPNTDDLLDEARAIYPNTEIAEDLMIIDLPLVEN